MNSIIKKLVRAVLWGLLFATITVVAWETVRPTVTSWIPDNTVVYRAPAPEPSEFELWQKTDDVQEQLALMYKKYQRDELTKEITDLESKQ